VVGKPLDSTQTAAVIDGLVSTTKGSITSEGGAVALEWNPEIVHVRSLSVDAPFRFPITLPGETVSDEFGWKITAQNVGPEDFHRPPGSLDVVLSAEAIKGPPYFRSVEPGDTIQPLARRGTRKVGEVFSDMGITQAARRRIPLVCDLLGPVWVPGGPIADRVRVEPETKRCIRLSLGPV
jgi:tRNA(Ile)-lysidine synthase